MEAELIKILIPALGALFVGAFKSIKFVQEGEKGCRLRFGKVPKNKEGKAKIIDPGFVFLIPFVEKLKRHHVRQQTHRLSDQEVMIKDGLIFNVSAVVIFRVTDIYKALFEIDVLDKSIVDLCMGIMRDVLTEKKYDELANMEDISNELLRRLKEKASEWGVEFIQFNLTDCAPTKDTAAIVSVEAGVRLKMAALKKAAEELECEVNELPPELAAALVGIPMVTSLGDYRRRYVAPRPKRKKTFLEKVAGD